MITIYSIHNVGKLDKKKSFICLHMIFNSFLYYTMPTKLLKFPIFETTKYQYILTIGIQKHM